MTERAEMRGVLEALLFASDEPLPASRVAKLLEMSDGDVTEALAALAEAYARDERGFQLREVAGGWRLFTHPAFHPVIEQLVLSWDVRRLSQAALEALAVVAYHQPVMRQGVNAIRGVNSEGVLASLQEKGLVREVGRDRSQGNAVLYGTTSYFMERMGMASLDELPPLAPYLPDLEAMSGIDEAQDR